MWKKLEYNVNIARLSKLSFWKLQEWAFCDWQMESFLADCTGLDHIPKVPDKCSKRIMSPKQEITLAWENSGHFMITGVPAKWHLWNECRSSILMIMTLPRSGLCVWLVKKFVSTNQKHYPDRGRYVSSA